MKYSWIIIVSLSACISKSPEQESKQEIVDSIPPEKIDALPVKPVSFYDTTEFSVLDSVSFPKI